MLVAIGAVWIGQGLGLIRGGSFMVDDTRWSVAGAACVLVGILVAWRGRRARR